MGKTSLLGVARAYFNTLRSYRTKRVMLSDLIVQIGLPAVAAVSFAVLWPLGEDELSSVSSNVISGVSIVSALLCGVAVMVFQLRVQMSAQGERPSREKVRLLVDETFYDILWAVVAGFISVFLTVAMGVAEGVEVLQRVLAGLAVLFLGNFVLVTCMCVKRLSSTYKEFSGV